MQPQPSRQTVFKIIATRKTRQIVTLTKILILALFLPLALLWSAQVGICKYNHKDISVYDCTFRKDLVKLVKKA